MTPPSYPQVQAPIVNNPAFWERLGLDAYNTDTLFFAFYHQQVPNLTDYYHVLILILVLNFRLHFNFFELFRLG